LPSGKSLFELSLSSAVFKKDGANLTAEKQRRRGEHGGKIYFFRDIYKRDFSLIALL